ncbi:MAG TPA: hypothetical protein VMS76_03455 [Planctomycetota bacterium]|nr:hypothetical protein [Planctomycetota bacterium]
MARTIPSALLALAALPLASTAQQAWDGRTRAIHEWGTLVTVQGSGGAVLDGLLHEERDLPAFVYDLRERAGLTALSPKMETPVIYAYSPSRWKIAVRVRFPRGLITQWYPGASSTNLQLRCGFEPPPPPDGRSIAHFAGGEIAWGTCGDLTVLPPGEPVELPEVDPVDPWRFAREVAANDLAVCNRNARIAQAPEAPPGEVALEHERFLFYRGLGDFPLPLSAQVYRDEVRASQVLLQLDLENAQPDEELRHLVLIFVENGCGAFRELPDLRGRLPIGPLVLELRPVEELAGELTARVAAHLAQTGLFADEALAMARTWHHGWFLEEGLRVLYVLPAPLVERELPLEIEPLTTFDVTSSTLHHGEPPDEIVRTFIARAELLSPRREARMLRAVEAWAGADPERRAAAREEILAWGRFALPYLARVRELTPDPGVGAELETAIDRLTLRR